MNSIYAITTHHRRPDEAAEAWKKCGVCAIGWTDEGDLRKLSEDELNLDMKDFFRLDEGDVVLAYTKRNRIAYVGAVTKGKFKYNKNNLVGRPEERGGFRYANQRAVEWWKEPFDILRSDFPVNIAGQMAKRGKTVIQLDLGRWSFESMKVFIKSIPSGSASEHLDEDTIKAGIVKYLGRSLDPLEEGMKVIDAEKPISKSERPDFMAEDSKGKQVIIECKGRANAASLEQLAERYRKFAAKNARLLLIAFRIDDECRRLARRYPNVELREVDLKFKRV